MNFILRMLLTLSSISFFVVVYLIQNKINPLSELLEEYKWITYIIYLIIPFVLTVISLFLCKLLGESTINKVISIETSNNDFLANYLSFFFVALSIKGNITFWAVFGMTFLFVFVSRVSYFNPVFLVFGYNFYYITTAENVKVMLICKAKLKNPEAISKLNVKRINDYTFIGD